jgi:hypothetical protein
LLVQALLHLLVAVQNGAPPGPLRLRGGRAGAQLLLEIASAPGTGPARAGDAGDPGLSIARDIARDHGGELELRGAPEAPRALVLRLPLAEAA